MLSGGQVSFLAPLPGSMKFLKLTSPLSSNVWLLGMATKPTMKKRRTRDMLCPNSEFTLLYRHIRWACSQSAAQGGHQSLARTKFSRTHE